MIVQTKLAGERHFMFAMVYRFARAGICKAVTLKPVGLKSYVLKQSPCLFVQSIDHQILTFKLSLKNHRRPKIVAINFVHCKRRRQRIVYIYSIHKVGNLISPDEHMTFVKHKIHRSWN